MDDMADVKDAIEAESETLRADVSEIETELDATAELDTA